jgi:hypothetical protein
MAAPGSTKPNLLVIGAQKSGTTWLHHYLGLHPDIFMSKVKELHFFQEPAEFVSEKFPEYCLHFEPGRERRFRGETTPAYFWTYPEGAAPGFHYQLRNRQIPETVRAHLGGDVRLIIALRDPVARAISGFFHNFRAGRLDPRKSIREEGNRFGIIDRGHYKRHYERWASVFDERRLIVVFHDDIRARPPSVLEEIYGRLGVASMRPRIDDTIRNPGLVRAVVGGKLTVSPTSASKVNRRYFEGTLRCAPENGAVEVTQSDVEFLAAVYEQDIEFVRKHFRRPDLRWGARPLEHFVQE